MSGENNVAARILPNGSGAAAVLAAGVGSFALAGISFAADKSRSFASLLILYRPTGPLSGVTTLAIFVWFVAWGLFHFYWRGRNVDLRRAVIASFVLLLAAILLTFPPVEDLF